MGILQAPIRSKSLDYKGQVKIQRIPTNLNKEEGGWLHCPQDLQGVFLRDWQLLSVQGGKGYVTLVSMKFHWEHYPLYPSFLLQKQMYHTLIFKNRKGSIAKVQANPMQSEIPSRPVP